MHLDRTSSIRTVYALKNVAVFALIGMLIAGLASSAGSAHAALAGACNCVIFRLDDVQDWWLNSVQTAVMDQFITRNEKVSPGIVMNFIGNDSSVVNKVRTGQASGNFELVSHGWNHVDYSALTLQDQQSTLALANAKMTSLWGRPTYIFIPPYNSYDNDTLQALQNLGMKAISSEFDLEIVPTTQIFKSQTNSDIKDAFGIYHLPQQVGFYNYNFDPPRKNSLNTIMNQVTNRISSNGYAVVTLHPQDFAVKDSNQVPLNQVSSTEISDLNTLIDRIHNAGFTIKSYSQVAGIPLPPIVDNVAPVITPPADVAVVSSQTLTTVSLGTPTVTDNVDASPIVTNNAPSQFPQGTTTVTWNATDHSGNSRLATQYVTVKPSADTIKPSLTTSSPPSGTITGPAAGLNVLVSGTASDAQTGVKITEIRTSSSSYVAATPGSPNNWSNWSKVLRFTSSGSTTIVSRATDFWGNQQWFSTPVTITLSGPDTTPPQITAPPNITTEATSGLTPVLIGRATAFDNSDVAPVITSDAPGAGESVGFPLGTSTITWTAKDASGNTATATQTITIVDTTPPGKPDPVSPANGAQLTGGAVTFQWTPETDAVSDVSYDLLVANNPQFNSPVIQQSGITQSNFTATTPLQSGTYYWKVRSSDASANKSPYSDPISFTVNNGDPVVTATPAGGLYNSTQSVTLVVSVPDSTIYYTTDGSTPTTSSPVYASPVSISQNTTLQFFAVNSVGTAGPTGQEIYTIDSTAPTVSASPTGGTYTSAQSITLSANEPSTIYYTTDGSTPTASSTIYTSPIPISSTTTLKFIAKDTAGNISGVATENYIVNLITFPVVQMSDTTQTYGLATYSGQQMHVEFLSATSQLVGKDIDQITLKLRRTGSPTGSVEVGIFNADLTVKKSFGTISASTVATTYTDYAFSLASNDSYVLQSGDRIGIKYSGGDASNFVAVMLDRDQADPFDGVNTYRQQYNTAWTAFTSDDMYMILKQTHA